MSGVTGAVIGGAAVLATASSAYAASEQAGAQEDANAANAANAANTNATNLRMFQESRGSKGSSILPTYFTQDGKPYEPILAQQAMDAAAALPSAQEQIAAGRGVQQRFQPVIDATNGTVIGLYNGDIAREEQSYFQPVADARLDSAKAQKASGLEALAQTINEIKNIQAGRGYSGDTLSSNLITADQRRKIASQGAAVESAARIDNATDRYRMGQNDINRRIQNIALPAQQARANLDFQRLPYQNALDNEQRRQQPFTFFRIGNQAFQEAKLPPVEPVASTGSIVGEGLGRAFGTVGQLAAAKYINKINSPAGAAANSSGYPGFLGSDGGYVKGTAANYENYF